MAEAFGTKIREFGVSGAGTGGTQYRAEDVAPSFAGQALSGLGNILETATAAKETMDIAEIRADTTESNQAVAKSIDPQFFADRFKKYSNLAQSSRASERVQLAARVEEGKLIREYGIGYAPQIRAGFQMAMGSGGSGGESRVLAEMQDRIYEDNKLKADALGLKSDLYTTPQELESAINRVQGTDLSDVSSIQGAIPTINKSIYAYQRELVNMNSATDVARNIQGIQAMKNLIQSSISSAPFELQGVVKNMTEQHLAALDQLEESFTTIQGLEGQATERVQDVSSLMTNTVANYLALYDGPDLDTGMTKNSINSMGQQMLDIARGNMGNLVDPRSVLGVRENFSKIMSADSALYKSDPKFRQLIDSMRDRVATVSGWKNSVETGAVAPTPSNRHAAQIVSSPEQLDTKDNPVDRLGLTKSLDTILDQSDNFDENSTDAFIDMMNSGVLNEKIQYLDPPDKRRIQSEAMVRMERLKQMNMSDIMDAAVVEMPAGLGEETVEIDTSTGRVLANGEYMSKKEAQQIVGRFLDRLGLEDIKSITPEDRKKYAAADFYLTNDRILNRYAALNQSAPVFYKEGVTSQIDMSQQSRASVIESNLPEPAQTGPGQIPATTDFGRAINQSMNSDTNFMEELMSNLRELGTAGAISVDWGNYYQTTNNPIKMAQFVAHQGVTLPQEVSSAIDDVIPAFLGDRGFDDSERMKETLEATAKHEGYPFWVGSTGYNYLEQKDGPARGAFQVEPDTARDVLANSGLWGPAVSRVTGYTKEDLLGFDESKFEEVLKDHKVNAAFALATWLRQTPNGYFRREG